MSVVLIDQHVIHYEVLGRGRPLIFLHGWVGSWRYWIPAMQAASMAYRAYAFDFWGFGDSARYPANYLLHKQVDLIDSFLYEMGIGRVALIGHGLGAVAAVQYALRHPDVVDRVMAVSYPQDETQISPRLRATGPADLAEWLLDKSANNEPVLVDTSKTDLQAITTSLNDLGAAQLKEASRQLATSCLLVSGQNDPAVGCLSGDDFYALPELTHTVFFEQSGHFPMLDEGSRFNRLMADFLALPSGESPRQLQLKEEWKRRVR